MNQPFGATDEAGITTSSGFEESANNFAYYRAWTEIGMTDAIDVVDSASADRDTAEYSTERLGRLVTETRFEDLPEAVVAATRRMILDQIVCTAAASHTPMARALYALRADRGGTP